MKRTGSVAVVVLILVGLSSVGAVAQPVCGDCNDDGRIDILDALGVQFVAVSPARH